jgi:hypothetical protein
MNIRPEHLTAIRNLGYTDTEARFLYLVATHSGYFTQRHYLAYAHLSSGYLVHRLVTRLLDRSHARVTPFARNTHVYNLYSRRIYGVIDKDNLRNRRRQSLEMIHARLMILDFILANPHEKYLETEADKAQYFTHQLDIPLSSLPGRTYYGIRSASNTKRYFVDRFPIFLPVPGNAFSLPPVVTFVYCDTPGTSLIAYLTHLQHYVELLHRLSDFNLIFASAEPHKFDRARAYFDQQFPDESRSSTQRLLRYFQVRKLWDTQHTADLTRADRDFLRSAMLRFKGQSYESAYKKWAARGLSSEEAKGLLALPKHQPTRSFQTYVLPETYAIFSTEASRDYRNKGWDHPTRPTSVPVSTSRDV